MAINKTEQIYQQHIKPLMPSERLVLIELIARDLAMQNDHNVYTEPFDLKEFINNWSSDEIESIEQIYNNRESFFDGREFNL